MKSESLVVRVLSANWPASRFHVESQAMAPPVESHAKNSSVELLVKVTDVPLCRLSWSDIFTGCAVVVSHALTSMTPIG